MSRKITVCKITEQDIKAYVSSAITWGQFVEEYPEVAQKAQGMKVQCKEHRKTVSSSSYVLPEGDCSLYLVVEKVDSGSI